MSTKSKVFFMYSPEFVKFCSLLPTNAINKDDDEDDKRNNRSYLVHNLIHAYGLFNNMTLVRPKEATKEDLIKFHTKPYIDAIIQLDQQNDSLDSDDEIQDKREFGLVDDAHYFKGIYSYICNVAGGSISAARMVMINRDKCPVAFNWEGGRHHARAGKAFGFCYVNDVVLCSIELLRAFKRVLIIDIDVHHGDGVEEAFYSTDRAMTVSIHQYGQGLYPGTGDPDSIGRGRGVGYNVNIALQEGASDEVYVSLFEDVVINCCVNKFKPDCIVLVCGADSLTGDPLGHLNVSVAGYERCARMIKNLNLPTVVLGAGGYNAPNTARCFATVTAAFLTDEPLPDDIPEHDFYEFYSDNGFKRNTRLSKRKNYNTKESINILKTKLISNIETHIKQL
ncbi:histone deacetylase 1/2 [Acrasis kona]|uniref:Histone deacetylase n=1 Tax=Acrasis kona TaxID=1008807 RepID=A0AAW2Z3T0_9EUKA